MLLVAIAYLSGVATVPVIAVMLLMIDANRSRRIMLQREREVSALRKLLVGAILIVGSYTQAQPPAITPPGGIPITPERVELGRKLFFDPRISADGTIACATCHRPDHGFADDTPTSQGIDGAFGTRNAPSVIYSSYSPTQFWDGRVLGTAAQSLAPLTNPDELGNASRQQVIDRLNRIAGYRAAAQRAYGGPLTERRFAHAIASFVTSVISFDAPIDRRVAGYSRALTPPAERGYQLFHSSNCFECHAYPFMTKFTFANNGAARAIGSRDQGRFAVLGPNQRTDKDRRTFKIPTLREIGRTWPYMHNGGVLNLDDVIDGYSRGWSDDPQKDPRVVQHQFTADEKRDLVVFLREALASPSYPNIQSPGMYR